jgi:lipopolysaccharide/colanic/teichoic acid biosynthesis glycosyltransferase
MYGRLYCAGFEFVEDRKIGGVTWFVFRKKGKPQRYKEIFTGALIGLNRIGKNGKMFTEYKFRTMYPYSEYLQKFMIQYNKLQEGGKIKRDIRVTRIGVLCRRFWIDELPQFINLLKGDIKLVGVRPLSSQFFNLYTPELQQMRVKQKPGILPPFYADMPKTLDEIQDSEMTYLQLCEEKGVLCTDMSYLIRILKNILFKKARSK